MSNWKKINTLLVCFERKEKSHLPSAKYNKDLKKKPKKPSYEIESRGGWVSEN